MGEGVKHLDVCMKLDPVRDYPKYPLLPQARKILKKIGLDAKDLGVTESGTRALEGAKEKILGVVERGEYPPSSQSYKDEVATFYTSLILLNQIGDRALTEKFAVAFSKKVKEYLEEDLRSGKELLLCFAKALGWIFKPGDEHFNSVWLHFKDYLRAQPESAGKWKLVNRAVTGGYVQVHSHELPTLLEVAVRKKVVELVNSLKLDPAFLPDTIYNAVEELSQAWSKTRGEILERVQAVYRKGDASAFPPCMSSLYARLQRGENLPHDARFTLAAFLTQVGFSVDEVLEVFKASPDFNENVARYQVEHIAGLRGSKTKYKPYKCDNMRSHGLCRWRCEGVRHPLQFFYRALRGKPPRVEEVV